MPIERRIYPAIHMAFQTYAGPVAGIADALLPLIQAVRAMGLEPQGPPIALFPSVEQDPSAILARLCVPVDKSFTGTQHLRTIMLGTVEVAVARHRGGYLDIGEAYEMLSNWIDDEGLTRAEGVSETFVVGPQDGVGAEQWVTEVAIRLKAPNPEDG